MATQSDLSALGFAGLVVVAASLDIVHDDPHERGPFCRLSVEEGAPPRPGVSVRRRYLGTQAEESDVPALAGGR